jgi:lysophospholipase L1-like esterase
VSIVIRALVTVALLSGVAVSADAFWLPPSIGNKGPAKVVAAGDSITWGRLGGGDQAAEPYPATLQRLLSPQHPGVEVVNEGIPGASAEALFERLDDFIDGDRPIVVLIMIGTNDADTDDLNRVNGVVATIRQTVQLAKALGAIPILASMGRICRDSVANQVAEAINSHLPGVAADEDVRFVDIFGALNDCFWYRVDGLHPEQDGYDLMAAAWQAAVDQALNDALTLQSEVLLLRFDKELYGLGETLQVDLSVANVYGIDFPADVYFGAALPPAPSLALGCPDEDAVAFIADSFTRVVITCLADVPAAAAPLYQTEVPRMTLQTIQGFWEKTWTAEDPPGLYSFFLILTQPGDPTAVLGAATHGLEFAP